MFDLEAAARAALPPAHFGYLATGTDDELAAARVARARRQLQIYSTVASVPVEQVNEARGEAVWYQLYPTNDWDVGKALVTRAERAGCQVLVLTVDNLGNNRLTQERAAREDSRPCQACHTIQGPRYFVTRPMFAISTRRSRPRLPSTRRTS